MTQGVEFPLTIVVLSGSDLGPWNTVWKASGPEEVSAWLSLGGGASAEVPADQIDITGGEPLANGFNVSISGSVMPGGSWAEGSRLFLVRRTPTGQVADIKNSGSVPLGPIEAALDRLSRQIQNMGVDVARSLKVEFGDDPPEIGTRQQLVEDVAAGVSAEGIAQVHAAADAATATATAAITGQTTNALTQIEDAGDAVADEIGLVGGRLFDVIPASAGFDGGIVVTDQNGWTTDARWIDRDTDVDGDVIRFKRISRDLSGEVGAYRIYIRPPWPSPNPTAFWSKASVATSSGRHIANVFSPTPPSNNLFGFDTGDIRSTAATGMTFTKQYAVGPSGVVPNSAVRGQHGTTSAAFVFLSDVIPAATWRLEVQAQGNTAGTTNIQRGALTSLTADTITDTAWKSLPRDPAGIVSDGVTAINFQVRGSGANTPDIKYDRLQGYPTGSWVAWADEPPKMFHIKKRLSFAGSITVDANGEVIMTGGVNFAQQMFSGAPDVTTISDIALTAMVDVTGGAANTRIVCTEGTSLAVDPAINPITSTSTFYLGASDANGQLAVAPVNSGASGGNVPMKGAGPMILTNVGRTGMRGVLVDGHVFNLVNTAHTAFKARLLNWFGVSAGSGAVPGSGIAGVLRINQSPTMDMLIGDVLKLQDEFATAWARGGRRNKLHCGGDSVFGHGFGVGNAGMAFSQGDYGYHSRPLPTANMALSGSTYTRMRARWDQAGRDTVGIAPTWVVSDKDIVRYSRLAGNNVLFMTDVSFPNDIARFGTASVGGLIADFLAWAPEVKATSGNPMILSGPTGAQAATADQLAGQAMFETAMNSVSNAHGNLFYISHAGQPYRDWSATHYYDDKHMRFDTVGVGHWLAKQVIHDALAASGLILA